MVLGVMTAVLLAAGDAGVAAPRLTMREATDALMTLQGFAASPAALRDPKNAPALRGELARLSGLVHAFPDDPKAQEPATAALGALFSRYAAETARRLDARETDAVGMRIHTLTGLCFTCHTRERAPADFADAQRRLDALALGGLEQAQVLAATRQFDASLAAYRALLAKQPAGERALLEYARALQDAMALLVRVKDDAAGAEALLAELAAREDLPPFLHGTIAAWKKDVSAWRKEKFDARTASADALFARAQGLVAKANGGRFPLDERKDITWLRASGYLNLALGKNPKLERRGEALYLLGLCAGALRSPLAWDVDLLFFEACVRENPRSKLSRRCFQQLSERVYLGYTGSAGTFIPDDELARLAELRGLAD